MAGHQLIELDTFNTGIVIAGLTGAADSAAVAAGAGDLVVMLWYR
jgi:hypothetical protein